MTKLVDLTPAQVAEHAEEHGVAGIGLWIMHHQGGWPEMVLVRGDPDGLIMWSLTEDGGADADGWYATDMAGACTVTPVTRTGRPVDESAELVALRERVAELDQRLGDEQRKYIDAESELDHARHAVEGLTADAERAERRIVELQGAVQHVHLELDAERATVARVCAECEGQRNVGDGFVKTPCATCNGTGAVKETR